VVWNQWEEIFYFGGIVDVAVSGFEKGEEGVRGGRAGLVDLFEEHRRLGVGTVYGLSFGLWPEKVAVLITESAVGRCQSATCCGCPRTEASG
jgi:hypothetical protein